jgi:glutaredoxin-related protein
VVLFMKGTRAAPRCKRRAQCTLAAVTPDSMTST